MKFFKPTSPARRQMTVVDYSSLTSVKPYKPLLKKWQSKSGRNHRGVITVRHQGSGNKKMYRMIDFRQDKLEVPARVETLEYDPYRTAFIAKIIYQDGERRYILAAKDMKAGDAIVASEKAALKTGNRLPLKNIPVGYLVHNIEMRRGTGGKIARSAGSYAEVLAHDNGYTDLKLGSKEVRKVAWDGFASIGQVSNAEWNLVNIGKAGRSRWLGIRPSVRGTAMNVVDHQRGSGEGRQPRGTRRPKDIYGNVIKGPKTRNKKKWSNKLIIQRRPKIR